MKLCPICGIEYEELCCPQCGFDASQDYEQHPTFCPLPQGLRSLAGRQAAYAASRRRDECPCCGRPVAGDYCGYCGFHLGSLTGITSEARVDALAAAHRELYLSDLRDISVVNYHYEYDPEASRLEFRSADELRLADGTDCHPGIFWSEPLFAQLSTDDYPSLVLMLSYRWRGNRKTCNIQVPTVQTDGFWQVGLLMDAQLRLQLFLGSPTKFSVAEPVMLDLT